MPAPVIPLTMTLEGVGEETWYTLGELETHPLGAPYIPQFEAFDTNWAATLTARNGLLKIIQRAVGRVHGADEMLDGLVDSLHSAVLAVVKGDRSAPLYVYFFGAVGLTDLKRPVLGDELSTVKSFLPGIQGSTIPSISALAPAFVAAIATADDAVAKLAAAEDALRQFDKIGGKKTLIDAFNALRQSVYGELAAMPHNKPELNLPSDFADRFFRHASQQGIGAVTNVAEIDRRIAAHQSAIEAATARRAEITAKAEAKAARKKAMAEADATLQQAKEQRKEADQKLKDAEKAVRDAKNAPLPPAPPATPPATAEATPPATPGMPAKI